jgi:hypothetical protein
LESAIGQYGLRNHKVPLRNVLIEAIQAANLAVVDLETQVVVPRVPTARQIDNGIQKALSSPVGGSYQWPEHMADLYSALLTTKEPTT